MLGRLNANRMLYLQKHQHSAAETMMIRLTRHVRNAIFIESFCEDH